MFYQYEHNLPILIYSGMLDGLPDWVEHLGKPGALPDSLDLGKNY